MKRLLSLVGLLIALALLVAACGTEAVSRPDAEATRIAQSSSTLEPADIILAEITELATEQLTEIATEEATEVATEEATAEVTAEATLEATKEVTEEVTAEATEEVTAEATLDVTEEVTAEAILEATEEATAEATEEATEAEADRPSEEEIEVAVEAADAANGATLVNVVAPACSVCHSLTAETQIVGPGLWNLASRAETRVEGQGPYTYTYISILYSQEHIVEGFAAGLMPNYAIVISEDEVYDIIAYLWTLHD